MLTGSVVSGTSSKFSDLDIIIVINRAEDLGKHERVKNYEGVPIDMLIIPETQLYRVMERDLKSTAGAIIRMLKEGRIIKDNDSFLADAQNYAKTLYSNGRPSPSSAEIKTKIITITKRLEDLKSPSISEGEALFLVLEITRALAYLNLIANKKWPGKGKHLAKNLENLSSSLYNALVAKATKAIATNEKEPFINLAKENLQLYGGQIDSYSASEFFEDKIQNERITFEIRGNLDYDDIIIHFLLPLQDKLTGGSYKQIQFQSYGTLSNSVLISISGKYEFLKNIVLPIVEKHTMAFSEIAPSGRIVIQYKEWEEFPIEFGGQEAFNALEGLRGQLGNTALIIFRKHADEWNQDIAVSQALFLVIGVIKSSSITNISQYISYLYNEWIKYTLARDAEYIKPNYNNVQQTNLKKFETLYQGNYLAISRSYKKFLLKGLDELEIENDWFADWITEAKRADGLLNNIPEQKMKVYEFKKNNIPSSIPEQERNLYVIYKSLIRSVFDIFGVKPLNIHYSVFLLKKLLEQEQE